MMDIKIGTAQEPARGQVVCGDAFTIIENEHVLTIAIADGLGHGPQAAEASAAFCDFIKNKPGLDVEELIEAAHHAIKKTRGVAGSIIKIDRQRGQMFFSGIGNIECQALSSNPIKPICAPGIIGHRFRKTLQFSYELTPSDIMVFFTDGISSRFRLANYRHLDLEEMAQTILQDHKKDHDDRTCITLLCC